MPFTPVIAIHGGAGTILRSLMTSVKELAYTKALEEAISVGSQVLINGGDSTEAVSQAVINMEDCHLFNAGRGSVFTAEGSHEMDAAIMEGKNLEAGAVAGIRGIQNPILLAKEVMLHSEHVMLVGKGAEEYAKLREFEISPDDYFFDQYRYDQWMSIKDSGKVQLDHSAEKKEHKYGTVGAVALDIHGNVAAATSTGGLTNKKYGRVGDSPIIGVGNYANNTTCAVSCTGHGEYFMRGVVAYDISCLIEYKGLSLQDACKVAIHERLPRIGGDGGVIAVNRKGEIALTFNSEGMYRGYKIGDGSSTIRIYGD